MKRLLFTKILLFGLTFHLCGQNHTQNENVTEKPNAVFFAPLNLFNFVYPNFQMGYERIVTEKLALQIEGGLSINQSIVVTSLGFVSALLGYREFKGISSDMSTNNGFLVKGSAKYFVWKKKKSKLYVSPELFYSKIKSGITRSFLVSDPDFEYSFGIAQNEQYDHFFYNDEEKVGMNFKVGNKISFGKRLYCDFHIGFGFAYRNVVQTGIENPNDKMYDLLDDLFLGFLDKAAPNKWVPTIPINFKIGYRF